MLSQLINKVVLTSGPQSGVWRLQGSPGPSIMQAISCIFCTIIKYVKAKSMRNLVSSGVVWAALVKANEQIKVLANHAGCMTAHSKNTVGKHHCLSKQTDCPLQ